MTSTAIHPSNGQHLRDTENVDIAVNPSAFLASQQQRSRSRSLQYEQPTLQSVTVQCPAKTNITLHVGQTREDWGGRHALDTIYSAVGIYDTLVVSQKPLGSGFSLEIAGDYLGDLGSSNSDLRKNHAVSALYALAAASGRSTDISISIQKRIPVGAGLAGGSADAAGTLLALNHLWGLRWSYEQLSAVARQLGSDMPFCLAGGFAHGTGFGERIELIDEESAEAKRLRDKGFCGHVLIGAYQTQLSTPEVYAAFDVLGAADGDANELQYAAIQLHPRSGEAIRQAFAAGAKHAFVSGSGPSVVAYVPDGAVAQAVQSSWLATKVVDRIIAAEAPAIPLLGPEKRHPLTVG